MRHQRLYINIDHVATIRQARRTVDPDPVAAAVLCEEAGADGITAHLREDRRHIQDADIERLSREVVTFFNLEMAATDEMLTLAERLQPHQVTLVPEKREEVTTEGGLDLAHDPRALERAVERLRAAGVRTSLFVDPTADAMARSRDLGVEAVELHTGTYAHRPLETAPLTALRAAAYAGAQVGLAVHAGHGLNIANVAAVAAIPEIEELNIGHAIVGRAVFIGLAAAVREMREAMDRARGVRSSETSAGGE